jgi:hypothetical protein
VPRRREKKMCRCRTSCHCVDHPSICGCPDETKVGAAPAACACSRKLAGHFRPAARTSHVPREASSRGSRRKRSIVPTRPDSHQPPGATHTHSLLLTGRRRRAAMPVHYFNRTPFLVLHSCSIHHFDRNGNMCLCFLAITLFFPGNDQRLVEHSIINFQFTTPSGWKLGTQTEYTITIHACREGTDGGQSVQANEQFRTTDASSSLHNHRRRATPAKSTATCASKAARFK